MSNPSIESFRLKEAGKRVTNVYETMIKRNSESFKFSYSFYHHISLLASGVISLSITFLGYLISVNGFILNSPEILIVAWVFLLLAVFFSIYRSYYHDFFIHFQLQRKFTEAKNDEAKTIIHAATFEPSIFAEIHTNIDQKRMINESTKSQGIYEKARVKNEKEESKYRRLWMWIQKGTHLCFISGMTLMVLFAVLNIPKFKTQSQNISIIESEVSPYLIPSIIPSSFPTTTRSLNTD